MIIRTVIKNLKILFRSPGTILLLLGAPIVMMLVVGFAFSGGDLHGVSIGLVESDPEFFSGLKEEIEFQSFYGKDKRSGLSQCIDALKTTQIEMCISLHLAYINDTLTGAQVKYYIDETRPQVTQLILEGLDEYIDYQTRTLSTQTVELILNKVNATYLFIDENEQLIVQLKDDLGIVREELIEGSLALNQTHTQFENISKIFTEQVNGEYVVITRLDQDLTAIDTQMASMQTSLEELELSAESAASFLGLVVNGVQTFGSQENESIYNYVDIQGLQDLQSNISQMQRVIDSTQTLIVQTSQDHSVSKYQEDISNSMEELVEYMIVLDQELNSSRVMIASLIAQVDKRSGEIDELHTQLLEKKSFFKEIAQRDAKKITQPISRTLSQMFKDFKRVHQLSPVIAVLVMLFLGVLLSNVLVSLELNSKAYFRNLVVPLSQWNFIIGLIITSLIVLGLQMAVLYAVLMYVFQIPIVLSWPYIALISFHAILVFVLLGVFLGLLFESVQISILVTTFVILLMFLLSDIIMPLEIMPVWVASLVAYSPVVLTENFLRELFFFQSFTAGYQDLLFFYLYVAFLCMCIQFAMKRRMALN